MKALLSLAFLTMTAAAAQAKANDPIVMKINGNPVTKSEFEYFYNKNNQQELAEEKSFDEYVDLFINYKLKVAEAVARGVDTTQSYISELAGYRTQLAQPYLEDASWQDSLLSETLRRKKEQINASHILIMLNENAPAVEVDAAYAKIMDCKAQVERGARFDSLAMAVSEDPSAKQNGGNLGYFSAMQMVYSFESAAYNAPVGGLAVCRSRFGYHLIKVNDRRPDAGEVHVAHIMKMFPRGASAAQRQQAKHSIDSIYSLLTAGADFAELAKVTSDDQYTAPKGGEYPWIGSSARFPQEWLGAAFALTNVGDYSQPFATDFGYHIIRLLGKRAESELTDEMRAQMKEQLTKDPERVAVGKKMFTDRLAKEYNMTLVAKTQAAVEKLLADTTVDRATFVARLKAMKKPLLTISKTKIAAGDFADYVEEKHQDVQKMNLQKELDEWSIVKLLAYEDAHLDSKYADFHNLYKEYHDGILLFDVASEEVWNKASADSAGLEAYFEKHRDKYGWEMPRFKGAFVECVDNDTLINVLKGIYATNTPLQASEVIKATVLTDSTLTHNSKVPPFHIVNGIFSRGDNDVVDVQQFRMNKTFKPKPNMPVVMTFGKILATGPECVDDVRGAVISDYQGELETRWVEQLREKYKVEINQKVLDTVKDKK